MISLAVILIHNKGDVANAAQITRVFQGITKVIDTNNAVDEDGNVIGTYETYHYEITNLGVAHKVLFYQVIPQGVTIPSNLDNLPSYNVYFGNDQPSNTRRFFNWALKRSVDHGCDGVLYIDDYTQLTLARIQSALTDLAGTKVYVDAPFGKLVEKRVLLRIGQLVENGVTLAQAITDLKQRIVAGGFTNG